MVTWTPGITLEQNERAIIEAAMRYYSNSKPNVANALGISIRTVQNKINEYAGLPPEPESEDCPTEAAAVAAKQAVEKAKPKKVKKGVPQPS